MNDGQIVRNRAPSEDAVGAPVRELLPDWTAAADPPKEQHHMRTPDSCIIPPYILHRITINFTSNPSASHSLRHQLY